LKAPKRKEKKKTGEKQSWGKLQ